MDNSLKFLESFPSLKAKGYDLGILSIQMFMIYMKYIAMEPL